MKTLIAILGPTASGKTYTSVKLAKHYNTEVVSCDSRQFYSEMSIGTAKPGTVELNEVPHHFISHLSVKDEYTAGQYEKDAIAVIEQVFRKNDLCYFTGGSGLYANAVFFGIDEIPGDKELRKIWNEIYEKVGLKALQDKLHELDPEYYKVVDKNNHMRLLRAIEVCLATGQPYSGMRRGRKKKRDFRTVRIALEVDRELLYDRINKRVDLMMDNGLLEEVKALSAYRKANALQTVGYQEIFEFLDNRITLEEAVNLIKMNTRRYAKRQLTWLRKQEDMRWFKAHEIDEMIDYVDNSVSYVE